MKPVRVWRTALDAPLWPNRTWHMPSSPPTASAVTTAPATPIVFSHGTAPNRNVNFRAMARSAPPDPSFGSCRVGVPPGRTHLGDDER